MKKLPKIAGIFFGFIIFVAVGLYCYLALERKLHSSGEQEAFTERTTHGMFWHIVTSEEGRTRFMKKYSVILPQNDFSRNYLLVSDGRKIRELKYRLISRYQWEFPYPMGVETFEKTHYPHTMFVYRIRKIYIAQSSD